MPNSKSSTTPQAAGVVSLTAPAITEKQNKVLAKLKQKLELAIGISNSDSEKVSDLGKKLKSLEKESESLKRGAANFQRDDEIQLVAVLKQIARAHDAIAETESNAVSNRLLIWYPMDEAQSEVSKICQSSYAELIDKIGAALAPFHNNLDEARYAARNSPAVRTLTVELLGHGCSPGDSIERLVGQAKDVLRKLDALLNGSEIWSYQPAAAQ